MVGPPPPDDPATIRSPTMTLPARGLAALALAASLLVPFAARAQARPSLETDRAKASYMVGMDVGKSLAPAAPDVDMAAFERALRNAMSGGKPLIAEDKVQAVGQALVVRAGVRSGKAPAGTPMPEVAKDQVGYLLGAEVGRQIAPIADELDLSVLVQACGTAMAGGKPALTDAEADAVRTAFSQRIGAKMQARAAALGAKNQAEGDAFLAKNKLAKGVFTTASGLQYMVLRQGSGMRPGPTDKVRVNYRGTLLDGTEFDSSYAHGEPAEFPLDRVIPGWTEGLGLMPVGSKYRFWIPGNIAYGAKGTPDGSIGPNATLAFDVELLSILP
jgi:FKBP-type peptidyl-prolyl cis-trans isomerase FkpA